MNDIDKARSLCHLLGNLALPLNTSDRCQIANSFRAIIEKAKWAEAFDDFRREVSDAVEEYIDHDRTDGWLGFDHFIIPKSDPLVMAFSEALCGHPNQYDYQTEAEAFRKALAKRGGRIVFDAEKAGE